MNRETLRVSDKSQPVKIALMVVALILAIVFAGELLNELKEINQGIQELIKMIKGV